MCRSILSLSKIAHPIQRDHPFSQRNRTMERTVGVGNGSDRKVDGIGQNLKKRERGNIGGLDKIGRLAPLSQICKETLKISHHPIIKPTPSILAPPAPFPVKTSHPSTSHFRKLSSPSPL